MLMLVLPLWADVEVLKQKKYEFAFSCNDGKGEFCIPLIIFTINGYGKASIESEKIFSEFAEDFNNSKIKNHKKIYDAIKRDKQLVGIKLLVILSPTEKKNIFNVEIKFSNSEFQGFYEYKNSITPIISTVKMHQNAALFLGKPKPVELITSELEPLSNDTLGKKKKLTFKLLLTEKK